VVGCRVAHAGAESWAGGIEKRRDEELIGRYGPGVEPGSDGGQSWST
jgi:hypothetical protein